MDRQCERVPAGDARHCAALSAQASLLYTLESRGRAPVQQLSLCGATRPPLSCHFLPTPPCARALSLLSQSFTAPSSSLQGLPNARSPVQFRQRLPLRRMVGRVAVPLPPGASLRLKADLRASRCSSRMHVGDDISAAVLRASCATLSAVGSRRRTARQTLTQSCATDASSIGCDLRRERATVALAVSGARRLSPTKRAL